MAKNTNTALREQVIYSVYVRNHTPEGTFRAVIPDLDRIRALGTDIVWFMPIHPIGEKGKKGSLGCPYANRDYGTVNPEYGTLEDFKALVDAIHARGMKCIIDVVYNHTSPDAVYVTEHPEFYYRKPDGRFGNKTADWTDVIDLDYSCAALWDAQIQHLCYWAGIVDGFRCDVASLVPVEFWKKAREAVEKVHPGCIWLAESVHRSFLVFNRLRGITAATDNELYEAFDMEYEYDIRETFDKYIAGEQPLSAWMDMLGFQEAIYPENYVKLRYMENHDMPRIAGLVPDEKARRNFTALLYFLKGTVLLYGGQEYSCDHVPSLFDKDVFPRTGRDITPLLQKLNAVRREHLSAEDWFTAEADDANDIAVCLRDDGKIKKLGVFSLKGKSVEVGVPVKDGNYVNYITGETVTVRDLLYGAMLPSGAECCEALARRVSGSEEAFVSLMNQKAQELEMLNTHYANPTGLTAPDHKTTVTDLAKLLCAALNNETFRTVFTTEAYTSTATPQHPEGLTFSSTLLSRLNGEEIPGGKILGGKTGYTSAAGLCLASLAEIGGREYLLITLDAPGDHSTEPFHIQDAVRVYRRLAKWLH